MLPVCSLNLWKLFMKIFKLRLIMISELPILFWIRNGLWSWSLELKIAEKGTHSTRLGNIRILKFVLTLLCYFHFLLITNHKLDFEDFSKTVKFPNLIEILHIGLGVFTNSSDILKLKIHFEVVVSVWKLNLYQSGIFGSFPKMFIAKNIQVIKFYSRLKFCRFGAVVRKNAFSR